MGAPILVCGAPLKCGIASREMASSRHLLLIYDMSHWCFVMVGLKGEKRLCGAHPCEASFHFWKLFRADYRSSASRPSREPLELCGSCSSARHGSLSYRLLRASQLSCTPLLKSSQKLFEGAWV